MRTRVARSVVLVLVLAGVACFSAAGQTQSPTVSVQAASPKSPPTAPTQPAKRALSKKAATNPGRPANGRAPQQIDLTIHFK